MIQPGEEYPLELDDLRQAEIPARLDQLHSPNPTERAAAAKRLGELEAEVEPILAAMQDRNPHVRSAAAEALGRAQVGTLRTEVIDRLLQAVDDANDHVVSAAINSLGFLQAHEARDQIADCLYDGNPYVARAAILALGRLGVAADTERLMAFLDSRNPRLRTAAARAMAMLDHRPAGPKIVSVMQADLHMKVEPILRLRLIRDYIESLAKLQASEAIPTLVEIAHNQVGLRSSAVQALIDMQVESAVPDIAPLLADPSCALRKAILKMISAANYRAALPLVRPMLTDRDETVKRMAIKILADWRDTVSVDPIRWMCYHDRHSFVRKVAVEGLVALLSEEALPDLLALADDSNALVRQSVIASLAAMESWPREAVQALQRAATQEKVPDIAEIARAVLSDRGLPQECDQSISVGTRRCSLLPDVLCERIPAILDALECWQAGLVRLPDAQNLEELAEIDASLSVLIAQLRTARHQAENGT